MHELLGQIDQEIECGAKASPRGWRTLSAPTFQKIYNPFETLSLRDATLERCYYAPPGGLPPQTQLVSDRAVFTEAYAFVPRGVLRDIVTSKLPFWENTRLWVLARPLSGFAETFSQYLMEVGPQGGSRHPDTESGIESAIFVLEGELTLVLGKETHQITPGGFAFIPPDTPWEAYNQKQERVCFHWIRKAYQFVDGLPAPDGFVTSDESIAPDAMPDTDGRWATTRFMPPDDLRHDMHITIVTFHPGASIPFDETHVMEHGLYVLQGKAVYHLNQSWVEVEAGDFMWLRAFCPQACYAGGPEPFRYLLYKDVHRHMSLHAPGRR